jgi:UPF0755 protein
MNRNRKKQYIALCIACVLAVFGFAYYYFFSSFSGQSESKYVYIDNDDNVDSVLTKLSVIGTQHSMTAMKALIGTGGYAQHVRSGRYEIQSGDGAFKVYRHLKNGMQAPVNLTVRSVRTLDKLSSDLSKKLMLDSATIYKALTDEAMCEKYGYDTATIACMFVPNTYDIYWNVSLEKFLDRMKKEHDNFWNADRKAKAEQMGLTPVQVTTLASIVDEETANNAEKPAIAGMYYNRLMLRNAEYPNGMPLQADPTIKFAWKQFELHRIYNKLLNIKSPYNTYKNTGLPPGPIRIASIAGIDAVLNRVHHDYLYMCAKEDFSGTHNFARTYSEHMANAKKYSEALDKRGIK